jgi:MFS family permease
MVDARSAAATTPTTTTTTPPLVPALVAMTGLQALVALALFAPGVLAPGLGLAEADIGLFATAIFAVGMVSSMYSGPLVARFGSFGVALLCAAVVALAMAVCAGAPSVAGLVVAGLVLGLAFGPETPASSALLARLARPEQRAMVFSVRQTGNQIGAMLGSVSLPAIALIEPRLGFVLIVLVAIAAGAVFMVLRARYDVRPAAGSAPLGLVAVWRLMRDSPPLRALALISMPYSAMQLTLNAFFVSLAVGRMGLTHVAAGLLLAIAQAAGLAGRLAWGWVASRYVTPRRLLVALGVAMAACAVLTALASPDWPFAALAALAFAFGLTASGWNGVFIAEVARLAPEGRVPEATGAVLTAAYLGLVLGPLLVAVVAQVATLAASFAALAVLTVLALLPLLRLRR